MHTDWMSHKLHTKIGKVTLQTVFGNMEDRGLLEDSFLAACC